MIPEESGDQPGRVYLLKGENLPYKIGFSAAVDLRADLADLAARLARLEAQP